MWSKPRGRRRSQNEKTNLQQQLKPSSGCIPSVLERKHEHALIGQNDSINIYEKIYANIYIYIFKLKKKHKQEMYSNLAKLQQQQQQPQ